jgi:hypothetical protein
MISNVVLFVGVLGSLVCAENKQELQQRITQEKQGAKAAAAVPAPHAPAEEIVDAYLQTPWPAKDVEDTLREERRTFLRQLANLPDQTPGAVSKALPRVAEPGRRAELVGTLKRMHTRTAADVCIEALKDEHPEVRRQAVEGLRLMARKVNRKGSQLTAIDEHEHPPIPGLVPYLIRAADDVDELNREYALYALADSRDPAARDALRRKLDDPGGNVGFYAACLLTEFNDVGGLPVMKDRLARLRRTGPEANEIDYYRQAGMLFVAFERVTDKQFGRIPEYLWGESDSRKLDSIRQEHAQLLETWGKWWGWKP